MTIVLIILAFVWIGIIYTFYKAPLEEELWDE